MNIQIFGKSKCFDTKKAERWFKERRIKFQSIDLVKYGMAGKEFDSVLRAVGGIDNLIDWESKSQEVTNMKYMDDKRAKEDKVFDDPSLMKTPSSATAKPPPWASALTSGKPGNKAKDDRFRSSFLVADRQIVITCATARIVNWQSTTTRQIENVLSNIFLHLAAYIYLANRVKKCYSRGENVWNFCSGFISVSGACPPWF